MEIYVRRGGEPLHRQIYESIRGKIAGGELKTGDPLPTVRGLAKDLRISIITTARAYRDLERDGYIVTAVGKGSFVADLPGEARRGELLRDAEKLLAEAALAAALAGADAEEFARMAAEAYDAGGKK